MEQNEKLAFDAHMTEKTMVDFMYFHTYHGPSGILTIVLGIFAVVLGVFYITQKNYFQTAIFFIFALILLVYMPLILKSKGRRQVQQSAAFKKPQHYEFTDEGLLYGPEGSAQLLTWDRFTKAVSTDTGLYIYIDKGRALIMPKVDMGDMYPRIRELLSQKLKPSAYKVKK